MWLRGVWTVAAAAVVATAGAGRARAQAAPDRTAIYPVEIAGNGAVHSIEVGGAGGPVDCGYQCSLQIHPGRYHLVVKDTKGHRTSAWLDVHGPSRVTVTPGDNDARVTGKALTWLGRGALIAGGLMLFYGFVGHGLEGFCPAGCENSVNENLWYLAGGITLAAGFAVAVTASVWRGKGDAALSEMPLPTPPPSAARFRLAPAAGLRWTGLALSGRF